MRTFIDNDLLSIQEARILAETAKEAQRRLATFPQEKLDTIVFAMAEAVREQAKELAVMSSDETDYGLWQDKYIKNRFVCEYLTEQLRGMRCVGIIERDEVHKTMDVGVPVGVVAALSPATSPVSTTLYNVLIAIKAGNAILVSPHPRAQKTITQLMDLLIEVAEANGLPEGAIGYLHTVAKAGSIALMNHPNVNLILMTSVPTMFDEAKKSGKSMIYGGTGNGPVFIERTAKIDQAVADIIASKSFDHGIVTGGEQSIVVDAAVADVTERSFRAQGAYFMSEEEAEALSKILFCPCGATESEMAGKSAIYLSQKAGFVVPDNTRLLISAQKYVNEKNPYSREIIAPVLAYYVEDDWMDACEKCIELLVDERRSHTLTIHSQDEAVIEQFALKKPVARVLVNTPATFGALGMTTNLFPAMTLGSGLTGRGSTSDNVSPRNLSYIRRIGYGVREIADLFGDTRNLTAPTTKAPLNEEAAMFVLQKLLEKLQSSS